MKNSELTVQTSALIEALEVAGMEDKAVELFRAWVAWCKCPAINTALELMIAKLNKEFAFLADMVNVA